MREIIVVIFCMIGVITIMLSFMIRNSYVRQKYPQMVDPSPDWVAGLLLFGTLTVILGLLYLIYEIVHAKNTIEDQQYQIDSYLSGNRKSKLRNNKVKGVNDKRASRSKSLDS
jgi:hypothetical protein